MQRKQVYLDEAGERGLKRLAARTGRSEASHLREALHKHLATELPETDEDPLGELIGMVDDPEGPTDVAENHDRYLYGSAEKSS